MKSRGPLLVILSLLAGLAAVFLLFTSRQPPPPSPLPSVENSASRGYRALYLLLQERVGEPGGPRAVTAWRGLPTLARREGARGLFILAAPIESVDREEADDLLQWADEGGTLLLLSGLSGASRTASLNEADFWDALELSTPPEEGDFWQNLAAGPEILISAPVNPFAVLAPALKLQRAAPFDVNRSGALSVYLLGGEAAAWLVPFGRGRVIVLPDPSVFSNAELAEADNLALALTLAARYGAGEEIAFDEYHLGYGPRRRIVAPAAERASAGLVLQVLFAALLLLLARLPRFGRLRPAEEELRPPSRDTVLAVAGLYRAAGARDHAADLLGRRLAEARRLGAGGREARRALLKAGGMYEKVRAMGDNMNDKDLLRFARRAAEALEKAGLAAPRSRREGPR